MIFYLVCGWVSPDSIKAAWSSPGAHVALPPPTEREMWRTVNYFTSVSVECFVSIYIYSPLGKVTSPELQETRTQSPAS